MLQINVILFQGVFYIKKKKAEDKLDNVREKGEWERRKKKSLQSR